MAGSPSELLRTSDHLKGVQEATDAHWAAIREQMGKKSVAGTESGATAEVKPEAESDSGAEEPPKVLPEPLYSN